MEQNTHALSHYIGLDAYGPAEADEAFGLIMRITNNLPSRTSCAIGGLAVVTHIGKAQRQISPDLDLLVDPTHLATIAELVPVRESTFGFALVGSTIDIDIIASHDAISAHALDSAKLMNLVGTLIRVIAKADLIALKFLSGRDKDYQDINILLQESGASQAAKLQNAVKDLLLAHVPDLIDDFNSWLNAFNLGFKL